MQYDDALTSRVKELALASGFVRVGIAPIGPVEHSKAFRAWLDAGYHAGMGWLEENIDIRLHPEKILDGARSVICLAVSYAPADDDPTTDAFVARYARGRDYHKVLKKRAHTLCDRIREIAPTFSGRAFVDTAPIAERSLAAAAGLGWIGKNGSLIVPGLGSYVLLAEIVCNLPLRPDTPCPAGCGDCKMCIAACPTGAIVAERTIDARRCLSYQTIENRDEIPADLWPKLGKCVIGCDACQAICPHNRCVAAGDAELTSPPGSQPLSLREILSWTESDWDRVTQGRAFRRAEYRMFLRNAILAAGHSRDASLIPLLERHQADETLQPYVEWARKRIQDGTSG